MATDERVIVPANTMEVADRAASFDAAISAHRAEEDRREAAERGEVPRGPAPRMGRIYRWVDVGGEYEGWQYRAYINFPQRVMLDIRSQDAVKASAALREVVTAHNGWCDPDGNPYPPADDSAFWEAIPTHLAIRVIQALNREVQESPFPKGRSGS
jgi:hypothetical protein